MHPSPTPHLRLGHRLLVAGALLLGGSVMIDLTAPHEVAANGEVTCGSITSETIQGGDGTSMSPWDIGSAGELLKMTTLTATPETGPDLSDHFALDDDLDLSGCADWPGIGSYEHRFTGTFDGADKTISGLTITSGDTRGLFNVIEGAEIANLTLAAANISLPDGYEIGGLAGVGYGVRVQNVHAAGSISGLNSVDGLIGALYGLTEEVEDPSDPSEYIDQVVVASLVADSSTDVAVTRPSGGGVANIGGLIGYLGSGVTVTHSHSVGAVIAVGDPVGGLIGSLNSGSTVSASYATGDVETDSGPVGGLVGVALGTIETSFARGSVSASSDLGGLVGVLEGDGVIRRSFATGNVLAVNGRAGGLVGEVGDEDQATIEDSYAHGNVSTTGEENYKVGGLAGTSDVDSGSINRTYAIGLVSTSAGPNDTQSIGGLLGQAQPDTNHITSSYWDTETSLQGLSAGGLGKTTTQMKDPETFSGWSITAIANGVAANQNAIWAICTTSSGRTYPFLMWQAALPELHPGAAPCLLDSSEGTTENTIPGNTGTTGTTDNTGSTTPPTTVPPTTTTPAPLPVAGPSGGLPTLTPGDNEVLVDGKPVTVTTSIEEETDLVLRGDDFELRLAAQCSGDCRIQTDAAGRQVLTLEASGRARVDGQGFAPGTPVYVWLFSTPVLLGELTVAGDGSFTGTVPVGDIAPGTHTLQVNGTSADGKPRTANLGVQVVPNSALLPSTGSDSGATGAWILLLISLGALLTLATRRPAPVHTRERLR